MIRRWFRALTRHLVPWQKLFAQSHSPVRLRTRPRLETLEDRTVTSTMTIVESFAPLETTSYAQSPLEYDLTFHIPSGDAATAFSRSANTLGLTGPGLVRILGDIRKLEAQAPELQSQIDTVQIRFVQTSFPDANNTVGAIVADFAVDISRERIGDTDQQFSPANVLVSVDGNSGGQQNPPDNHVRLIAVDPGVGKTSGGRQSLLDGVARLDKFETQPGADASVITAVGAGQPRLSSARPPAASENPASPAEHAATYSYPAPRADQAVTAQEVTGQVNQSRPLDDTVARPAQPTITLIGAEIDSVGSREAHQSGTSETQLRTEVKWTPADISDGLLLQRFVVDQKQEAFTAIVQRYERLVLDVCQGVLGDSHIAQDAFQATFLVLARKASMVDGDNPLAAWLYKVAYHVALRLRAVAARQRRREKDAANDRPTSEPSESCAELEKQELCLALTEELQQLPEKYREPLFLCYFEGRTHEEVASVIGIPRGSMAKRIGEGLERLRERLLERGFIP